MHRAGCTSLPFQGPDPGSLGSSARLSVSRRPTAPELWVRQVVRREDTKVLESLERLGQTMFGRGALLSLCNRRDDPCIVETWVLRYGSAVSLLQTAHRCAEDYLGARASQRTALPTEVRERAVLRRRLEGHVRQFCAAATRPRALRNAAKIECWTLLDELSTSVTTMLATRTKKKEPSRSFSASRLSANPVVDPLT
jgi:hypothetical protein